MQWDLVIIGAGPAGMAAALEAGKLNLRVAVIDRQDTAGGQIFRGISRRTDAERKAISSDYAKGAGLVRSFESSTLEFFNNATVWNIVPGAVYVSRNGKSTVLRARQIIIASGAMERPVPLPGWTLPGVYPAGAADGLLKSSSLLPEGPVVLCGNGPLVLQTVEHLLEFKIPIEGTVLTGDISAPLRAAPSFIPALRRPGYLAKGTGMMLNMLLRGHCYPGSSAPSISKEKNNLFVSFTSLGRKRKLKAGTVLIHEGIIPETRISRLIGCAHAWDAVQRYWHPDTDIWGRTSIAGIRIAGDCAKVRGAESAMEFGRLAALDAALELGIISAAERGYIGAQALRAAHKHIGVQNFMDKMFAPSPRMLTPRDEALLCRCEELTAAELKPYINAGCHSMDGLKAQARPGMGMCQGRMCGPAVAELIADVTGLPPESISLYHAQMPLFPLSLQEMADAECQCEGSLEPGLE